MAPKSILALLDGGDRRTLGRSDQAVALVSKNPNLFDSLIAGLWSKNPLIRMRTADATEKITRKNREFLQPYKQRLLGLMVEATQQELRWHLALMVPRLPLNGKERELAATLFNSYLEDRSSIVRTCALQGLAALAEDDPGLRRKAITILRAATQHGTPAMRARSRKLLLRLEHV
jgi:hypothetical protein